MTKLRKNQGPSLARHPFEGQKSLRAQDDAMWW
jgi:hypothetical protein